VVSSWKSFVSEYRPSASQCHTSTCADGSATLSKFEVWAYQVDHSQVRVGDPIDLSKRLDGTTQVRLSA